MRRLLLVLVALVVLLIVADFVLRTLAAAELRDRVRERVPGARESAASIESFPFLGRLLAAGSVPRVKVRVRPVVAGPVTFDYVDADLHDVHLDRDRLVRERSAKITGIGSGKITARVTQAEISRLARTTITFSSGRASVTVRGVRVSAPVSVTAGRIIIGRGAVAVRFAIPRIPLMPCAASSVVVREGVLDLSCTVHDVPEELLRRAQGPAAA